MVLFIYFLSKFFLGLGLFFIISSIIGLIRYNDFYIKLHTLSMFNIYGATFVLLSISISSYKHIIFFELVFLAIINIISSIVVVNVLLRNAILNNIHYEAKTRDEIIKEETARLESKSNTFNKKIEKKPLTRKNSNNNEVIKKEEENIEVVAKKPKEEMTDIEKENEELKKKIREQKRILKKKIETVRRNAFITRKPEEIQKAEDLIKGILDKYHLTEEMLNDDYED